MSVATNYARALFESLGENGERAGRLGGVIEEVVVLANTLEGSKDLQVALSSPVLTVVEKRGIVEALAQRLKLSKPTSNFLHLLLKKKRISELSDICGALKKLSAELRDGLMGEVVSADPITDEDLDQLSKSFSKKLGKKVEFSVRQDPALIAGIRVTVSGVTYDGSLQNQLERMRQSLF